MRETMLVAAVLPLRLFLGWVFLQAGLLKVSTGWLTQNKLTPILEGWLHDGKTYPFFVKLVHDTFLPHAQLFGRLVAAGELLVGAALLIGLFTRFAALCALLMTASFLLARGDGVGANATAPYVVMSLVLLCSHAGRFLGLDAAMKDRLPAWLT